MDQTNQIIVKVKPLHMPNIIIETNTGKRYTADLSKFKSVYCFPKLQSEWNKVSITTAGYNLTWACRFEVHVDQVINAAQATECVRKRA